MARPSKAETRLGTARKHSTAARALIVEDDPSTRTFIVEGLRAEGLLELAEAESAEEAETVLSTTPEIDILILDLGLPRISGLQFLRMLRTRHELLERLGIIIVTANNNREDRLECLELGADHFVNKPVQIRELRMHAKNLLKRLKHRGSPTVGGGLSFAGLVLWPDTRQVIGQDGRVVDLTRAEFELLFFLLENPSRAFTRDQLLDAISGPDGGPADRAIDNLIRRLRAKLGDDARNPSMIKTLHGHGYAMACQVAPVDPSKHPPPTARKASPT